MMILFFIDDSGTGKIEKRIGTTRVYESPCGL